MEKSFSQKTFDTYSRLHDEAVAKLFPPGEKSLIEGYALRTNCIVKDGEAVVEFLLDKLPDELPVGLPD